MRVGMKGAGIVAAAALTVVILVGAGYYALVIADDTGSSVGFQSGDLVKPTAPPGSDAQRLPDRERVAGADQRREHEPVLEHYRGYLRRLRRGAAAAHREQEPRHAVRVLLRTEVGGQWTDLFA